MRWLLGEEIVAATVRAPRSTKQAPERPARPAARAARDRERRADRRRGVRQRPLRLRHPLRARGGDRHAAARRAGRAGLPRALRDRLPARARLLGRRAPTDGRQRVGRLRRQRGRRRVPGVARERASAPRSSWPSGPRSTTDPERSSRPIRADGECHKLVTISREGCTTLRIRRKRQRTVPRVSPPPSLPHSPGRIHHGSNPRCHHHAPCATTEPDRRRRPLPRRAPRARTCARTRSACRRASTRRST